MKSFSHGDTELILFDNGNFTLAKKGMHNFCDSDAADRTCFQLSLYGGRELLLTENEFEFDGVKEDGSVLKLGYINRTEELYVTAKLEFSDGLNVVSQRNTVKNIGTKEKVLTRFASAYLDNAAHGGSAWYERQQAVYTCANNWQGEGQWNAFSPRSLGLYPSTIHPWENRSYEVSTTGSWSTAGFYPLVMIEDKSSKLVWFMETEGSHSWAIKISAHGGYAKPSLSLAACSCDEALGGWRYTLHPGEEYSAERAFFGIADGGFEGAVCRLNSFKRADSLVRCGDGTPPIVFNDYMNCLWTNQSYDKLVPLIKSAAEAGCEIFCIDDGWQTNKGGTGHGDWIPKDIESLRKTADLIRANGMIPGIWFELDACNDNAFGYTMSEDCVLKRYDSITGRQRAFYNFKSDTVKEYLYGRIKTVYDLGFRFIKNDYNQSTGIGCTNICGGNSPAEGLIQNTNAFYDFIDSLYVKFPGLIIENCGSGAMRDDNKMLRRGMLQSISDQEIYLNNPSVMMGSLALMPPEKAGIWSYPYPLLFEKKEEILKSAEYRKKMENGFETVFNMVNAMFGSMYLSGRIDMCDGYNMSLIKEGTELYKGIRGCIPHGRPVYPTGFHPMNERGYASFGLLSRDALLLGVWNINGEDGKSFEINLSGYISGAKIERFYPHADYAKHEFDGSVLKVSLLQNTAVFFVISKEDIK